MIRRFFVAILALLAIATAAVGTASYGKTILFGRFPSGAGPGAVKDSWELRFDDHPDYVVIPGVAIRSGSALVYSQGIRQPALPWTVIQWWGFMVIRVPGSSMVLALRIPLWLPFLLFSVYPVVAFLRGPYRRRRRRKKGLCIHCGYNLTGNVSGVCPECGERIPADETADRG